jgi:cobalt-zinc-cadmium efflux system outer membrane protein
VGDVAALDVNLAASALSRSRSDLRVAEAESVLGLGELKVLLVLEPEAPLTLAGDLALGGLITEAALVEATSSRPDLKALEAELQEAEADTREGRASRWPGVTPTFRYQREAGTNILWGGMTLSLPLWNKGQTTQGLGEARGSRVRLELEALRRAVRTEVHTGLAAHRLRLAALAELQEAAARLEDNEGLARRSYEVGQIGLTEVLLVRRETTDARVALLKRRLEAVESEIGLLTRAGVLR